MKKYICLFVCIAISSTLLAGCSNYGNSISASGIENASVKTDSSQAADSADRKPTTYETVNNFEGVAMTLKKGTVSPDKLTVIFENNSSSQCIYGEFFELERKIDGKWYKVPVAIKGNYGFNSIGYNLAPGEVRELTIDWNWLYGSLGKGEYRIVKDILDFRDTGDYDTYILVAEFSIMNSSNKK